MAAPRSLRRRASTRERHASRWLVVGTCTVVCAIGAHASSNSPAAARWGPDVVRQDEQWYASPQARELADSVVEWQSREGGWPKNTDLALRPSAGEDPPGGERANTIDNGGTTLPLQFLARVAQATGQARHRGAFARGVDYLLAAQYANGGWPQFYPLRPGYYSHVTFNDNATVNVLNLLRDVAAGARPYAFLDDERRARAAAAVSRGIDCILRTQIRQDGVLTAWCAQYDEQTLEPAWARAYEPPSLSGSESVGLARFLMGIDEPAPAAIAAVEAAVGWLRRVAIHGLRLEQLVDATGRRDRRVVADPEASPLWARFYELGSNRPIFLGRDSQVRYSLAEIEQERRGGYAYYGTWPAELLAEDYPRWRARLAAAAAASGSSRATGSVGAQAPAARPLPALSVDDLRCEGLREAPQVDTAVPRFSWRLVADGRDVRQVSYQLRLNEVDAQGQPLGAPLEAARVESDETQWVAVPGFTPRPRAAYAWQVRVWDNHGNASGWSETRGFGTGLLGDSWPADWIGDGRALPLFESAPARHFRGTFTLERRPVRARLFVSALGLVEPWLNGGKVTQDQFVPGWPDYRRRVFYAAFDVTDLLQPGDNTLGMILGDGWYSGTMIPRHQYGQEAMLSAFLDLTDEAGRTTTVTTGEAWRWSDLGPITMNSIYHGESYDARRELVGWSDPRPSPAGEGWRAVRVRAGRHTPAAFTARMSPPVRRIEELEPVAVERRGPDAHVYDLGQNMAGWVRLRVEAEAGREITLRFAEMREPDGTLHTANLRSARATARYVARGAGVEEWEPRFTYFGFRYVELSGVERPRPDAIRGVVLHSALPPTGEFESSSPLLDQLWRNTLWSQKGNFLELPTDCPQRDERAGWTGDAQIFAATALYNMDAGAFFRQWLFSLRDGLRDDPRGGYPDVAPYTGFGHGSPGWAEAGVIVPWTVWLHTGDRRVLAENLPAIQHALELMAAQSPDGIRRVPASWGDWLAPGFPRYRSPPRQDLIATAYYAHAADLAARMADALGRPELAASNRALRDQARAAYQRAYIAPDGRVADDVQTSYLLTLAFDLAPPVRRAQIAAHLVRTFAEKNDHLATGFLGTPLILPVLSEVGRLDLAYTVLQQTSFPGWLFPVQNGATTIWERWDSWTPERGFHEEGMNSFNHYAYGSVVSWFYDTIAGLRPLPEAPGWKRFRVAPRPGGGLTRAAARIRTPHGDASSAWRLADDRLQLLVGIPPNTDAEVVLPVPDDALVRLDGLPLARHQLAKVDRQADGRLVVALPAGRYELRIELGGAAGAGAGNPRAEAGSMR